MTNIDIVMLSDSKNNDIKKKTQKAIKTLHDSEEKIEFKVYLVESNDNIHKYDGVHKFIHKNDEKFNFNRFMNIGRKEGNSPYVCLSNNDVIFKEGWASTIIHFMDNNPEVLSTSPRCEYTNNAFYPDVEYGYKIIKHIAGWCIFQKREIYDIIGDLDEQFNFWFADNDYGQTLKSHDLKHAKVNHSVVNHLQSVTLDTHDRRTKNKITREQRKKFNKKWNK